MRHATTGGTRNARYCYTVWLRHLLTLQRYGFRVSGARVAELGPGDSIGTGLAALLSGANRYIGLDAVAFSANADLPNIFDSLLDLFARREPIPDPREFPRVRPVLDDYQFPAGIIEAPGWQQRAADIRSDIARGITGSTLIRYYAPWNTTIGLAPESADLVFSQAVLEYVDDLVVNYRAVYRLLRPGGFASHTIDFSAGYLSPYWNGHWAYSAIQWRITRGRREYFLNRQPLGAHLQCAVQAGFQILHVKKDTTAGESCSGRLAHEFDGMSQDDRNTSGAFMILQKPTF